MMLKLVLTLLLFADPEVVCRLGASDAAYNAYSDQSSSGDALELASRVNAALVSSCRPRCPRISMFRNPTASNLMLIHAGDYAEHKRDSAQPRQMKLVYKPDFFTKVYENEGDGGILALLAHEVGHAIEETAAPQSWMKGNWSPELRADAWAGCALARMNLSSRALQAAYRTLSNYPSVSHPDWNTRLPVIQAGYSQCGGK